MSAIAPRRSRALRRPAEIAPGPGLTEEGRGRIRAALDRWGEHERTVLAILLLERLTPDEAAGVLGVPVRQLVRTFRSLMAELARAAQGLPGRPLRVPASGKAALPESRLRRA
jgi:DNA-directed RNA polymerase specialized sigma24 family protein